MSQQQVIDSLLETCESLYLQGVAMESMLDKVAPEDWRHMLGKILKSDEAIQIRASFHHTLQSAVCTGDPAKVLAVLHSMSRHLH